MTVEWKFKNFHFKFCVFRIEVVVIITTNDVAVDEYYRSKEPSWIVFEEYFSTSEDY